MGNALVQFPRPAEMGATRAERLWSRLTDSIGRALCLLRLPGAITDQDIADEVTGQCIQVRVGTRFTRLNINGRDYYFCRYTGRLDGTGMGCG